VQEWYTNEQLSSMSSERCGADLECRNLKDQINSSTRKFMETTGQEEADKAVRRNNWEYFPALGFMVIQYHAVTKHGM
jgi:hypothetical protein